MTESTPLSRAQAWVDAAYAALARDPGFRVRPQQVDLSKAVAQAFFNRNEPLAAEAPTGTGKTIAYLIGALAASNVLGDSPIQPIVLSTATKALQAQLFEKDLPALVRAGLIQNWEAALAKGKGNYLCLSQAAQILDLLSKDGQETFVDDGAASFAFDELSPLIEAARGGKWDGDFDTWKGKRPGKVYPIAVSSDTCTGKKCDNFSSCTYFKARNKLLGVRVIVANHDLVLRDLILAEDEQAALPVSDYYVVFDEGHHLPEKAIAAGAREAHLSSFVRTLPKLGGLQRSLNTSPELSKRLARFNVDVKHFDREAVSEYVEELIAELAQIEVDAESSQHRFPKGELPKDFAANLVRLTSALAPILAATKNLIDGLRELMPELPKPLEEKAVELLRRALDIRMQGKAVHECASMMVSEGRRVKWVFRKDDTYSLHCSPLEGADVLRPLLWASKRTKGVVIVSATLRDINGFTRYQARSGLPETAQTMVLPYTFPYQESQLLVAGMNATPKPSERKQFLAELAIKMPAAVNPAEATLVLFPSWSMLREFAPLLRKHFGYDAVLVQGEQTVSVLRELHSMRVDSGKGSILVGTATLAEGLDLPGSYCTHVMITALPFAVPSDPVEQELSDLLGSRYFAERSLPDAMTRLVQMVGRLLRRETDRGRVTIFDRRLASMSYGRKMLEQLPPFEKIIERIAA